MTAGGWMVRHERQTKRIVFGFEKEALEMAGSPAHQFHRHGGMGAILQDGVHRERELLGGRHREQLQRGQPRGRL